MSSPDLFLGISKTTVLHDYKHYIHHVELTQAKLTNYKYFLISLSHGYIWHCHLTSLASNWPTETPEIYIYAKYAGASEQEAQLSPRDHAMRRVSWNLANCHTTVQKLLYDKSWTNQSYEVGGLKWANV